ncbi:MAG: hypothetical protein QM496_13020 [Verrucomicrobiota bacterium]
MTWSTAIIVLAISLVILSLSKKSKQKKALDIAKQSNADIDKTFGNSNPDYQPTELRSVKRIDYSFYEASEAAMYLQGFSNMGDYQDLEHRRNFPKQQTVVRFMVSKDHSIMAAFYHLPIPRLNKLLLWLSGNLTSFRTIDLETEFTDGYFVMTTTAAMLLSAPPGGRRNQMPESTSVSDLVQFHNEAVESYRKKHPGVDAISFNSFSDIIESQERGVELMRQHRKNMGGLTKAELTALMPSHIHTTDPKMANELEAAFDNERNSVIKPGERGSPFED